MTVESFFSIFSLFFITIIFFMLPVYKKTKEKFLPFYLLICLVILFFLHSLSNFLEWSGFSNFSDFLEDNIEILIPIIFGIIFLYYIQSKIEEKSYRANINFNNIYDKVNDFIFVMDAKGKILDVNLNMIKQLGYDRNELIGKNIIELHPQEMQKTAFDIFCDILDKKTDMCNLPLQKKDGTLIPVESRISRTEWDDNINLIGISRDITERMKYEEKLRQSDKLQAVGQLAGGIAHDFNNQLAAIMGYAEIMSSEADNPDIIKLYSDNIIKRSKKSSDLANKLLSFAQKGKYFSTPVNIHELLNEIIVLLKHSIDKRILIFNQFNADRYIIKGDPSLLKTAFLNICNNSVEAMIDGGELTIITRNEKMENSDNTCLCIDISDNGIGMDHEVLKHIFEPFFTTKDSKKQIGLGLPAAYGALKSHKGELSVFSKPGEGSRFSIELPIMNFETDKWVEEKVKNRIIRETSKTCFILDDDRQITEVMKNLLSKFNFHVQTENDPEKALIYYKSHWNKIDLVILDLVLPKYNGKEVFHKFIKMNPRAKILLISGFNFDQEVQELIQNGAKDFLQKPFELNDLLQKINSILLNW